MAQLKKFTVHQLVEELMKFIKEHEGDARLNQPVTVMQYEEPRNVHGIKLVDVTDGCGGCDDDRCAYGGPKQEECPINDLEAEVAGFVLEGLHWAVVIEYDEVD